MSEKIGKINVGDEVLICTQIFGVVGFTKEKTKVVRQTNTMHVVEDGRRFSMWNLYKVGFKRDDLYTQFISQVFPQKHQQSKGATE